MHDLYFGGYRDCVIVIWITFGGIQSVTVIIDLQRGRGL